MYGGPPHPATTRRDDSARHAPANFNPLNHLEVLNMDHRDRAAAVGNWFDTFDEATMMATVTDDESEEALGSLSGHGDEPDDPAADIIDRDTPACPECEGDGVWLGQLGDRAHYRCRACGWTYSLPIREAAACGFTTPRERACGILCRYIVCPTCDGAGSHVNPSIDSEGLTAADFEEAGPEFFEDYRSGTYDVPCYECGGKRVVPWPVNEADEVRVRNILDARSAWAAEEDAERRMGC